MTENPKTSAAAIWSLVLGILSLILCSLGFIFGIPAVICGHIAKGNIQKSAGTLTGDGFALTGLITGYLGIVISLLLMLIAIPNFLNIRAEYRKSACQNGQRLVAHATEQWASQNSIAEGAATEAAAITGFLKNNALPICPAHNMPIAIPAHVGEKAVCPDPDFTDKHTLP